jgi:hypothetical protein
MVWWEEKKGVEEEMKRKSLDEVKMRVEEAQKKSLERRKELVGSRRLERRKELLEGWKSLERKAGEKRRELPAVKTVPAVMPGVRRQVFWRKQVWLEEEALEEVDVEGGWRMATFEPTRSHVMVGAPDVAEWLLKDQKEKERREEAFLGMVRAGMPVGRLGCLLQMTPEEAFEERKRSEENRH